MNCSYLGPEYSDEEIENILKSIGANYKKTTKENVIDYTTNKLTR